ncbi:hypothetical protein CYG48_08960 [Neorhizobium sp. SOG26]|uniref:Arc family DNA-binding protein n=1 Tax=Neorhizobium sp. SOG26 TaxID=2060726 RepID=UPI000E57C963|nr:Arc family DNA-binding protein [Neorhizobium sp. SOG26]AXV15814.1 hypothetical protein CYG48_08960 [Neorhizobium sp. SOG26]
MVNKFPCEKLDKFMVRMPDGLRTAIKLAAIENGRTMNAEVVYHLKRIYEPRQSEKPAAQS